jgi:hypothetical protein
MKLTGTHQSTRGKTCSSANLCTTNPTLTDPRSNKTFNILDFRRLDPYLNLCAMEECIL